MRGVERTDAAISRRRCFDATAARYRAIKRDFDYATFIIITRVRGDDAYLSDIDLRVTELGIYLL